MDPKIQAVFPVVQRLFNPWFSDAYAKESLTQSRRMFRALLISARNMLYLLAAASLFRQAEASLPPLLVIAVLIAAAAATYWRVHDRDRRGEEVSPALLLGLFLLFFAVMAHARSLADQSGFDVRYMYVIELDRTLFGGTVPTVWLQEAFHTIGRANLLDVLTSLVYFSYFVVPVVVGTVLWHVSPAGFRLYLAATIVMIAVGSIVFTLLPTAPPWLAGSEGYLPPVTRIAPEVAELVRPGFYDRGYQAVGVNDVAAFPSYHTAQTLAVALIAWRFSPKLGMAGAVYAASMGFSLVYLGEHYVTDVLAGVALAGLSWIVALKLMPATSRRYESDAVTVPADGVEVPRAA